MYIKGKLESNDLNPMKVLVKRGSSVESIHRAHASICDTKGRTLKKAGACEYETFIRSALKPFQALPFITSDLNSSKLYLLLRSSIDGFSPEPL